jgi:hypothetical protein
LLLLGGLWAAAASTSRRLFLFFVACCDGSSVFTCDFRFHFCTVRFSVKFFICVFHRTLPAFFHRSLSVVRVGGQDWRMWIMRERERERERDIERERERERDIEREGER